MKGKLITNGILSIIWLAGIIMMIVALSNIATETVDTTYGTIAVVKTVSVGDAWYWLGGITIVAISGIASLIMGIITLASKNKTGLSIASGVLAILGGAFGVNAIVSFIAASKEV